MNLFGCYAYFSVFLLIPCFSISCIETVPCSNSTQINPPFFFSAEINTSCEREIKIDCADNIPTIYPFYNNYKDAPDNYSVSYRNKTLGYRMESISYENKTLILQDPNMAHSLSDSNCESFVFELSNYGFYYHNYLYMKDILSSFKCNSNKPQTNFYDAKKRRSGCSGSGNASFGWILSFNVTTGDLTLLSSRFSNPPCQDTGISSHLKIIIGLTAPSATIFILACCIFIIKLPLVRNFVWKHNNEERFNKILEKYGSLAPKKYKYSELKKITNSFQDKLGKGGFGTVYKGAEQNGRLVAVKILHNSTSNGEEFINEVISISRTSHVNVVNLLGFCVEGSKQALVYEYMLNGSLDKYIYSENSKTNLYWEKLYDIAIGIARGLEYLHSGCSTHIVHFDIKPQNILLDEDFHPKIADFGLAKLCPPKESILSLVDMRGTIGFIAPEVFSRSIGVVSTKSDVYSFGMLVLEMVGGRKNFKLSVQNSSQAYFPHWIYDHIVQGGEFKACDVTNETEEIARKMALVGIWCVQVIPDNRPSMSEVLEMFEKDLDEMEMPPKPYLNSPPRISTLLSSSLIF